MGTKVREWAYLPNTRCPHPKKCIRTARRSTEATTPKWRPKIKVNRESHTELATEQTTENQHHGAGSGRDRL